MATIEALERRAEAARLKAAKNGQDRALQLLREAAGNPLPADTVLRATLAYLGNERDHHAKRTAGAEDDNTRRYHATKAERLADLIGRCQKALEETYAEDEIAELLRAQAYTAKRLQQLGITA